MILVDSKGILLFFPLLLCYFFIFFYFYISSFGLLSLRTRLPAFLSINALRFDIFSMIYLYHDIFTANFEEQESHLHTREGNKYQECFHKLFEKEHNFFELHQNCYYFLFLFLYYYMFTHREDVFRLIMNFLQNFFMLLF